MRQILRKVSVSSFRTVLISAFLFTSAASAIVLRPLADGENPSYSCELRLDDLVPKFQGLKFRDFPEGGGVLATGKDQNNEYAVAVIQAKKFPGTISVTEPEGGVTSVDVAGESKTLIAVRGQGIFRPAFENGRLISKEKMIKWPGTSDIWGINDVYSVANVPGIGWVIAAGADGLYAESSGKRLDNPPYNVNGVTLHSLWSASNRGALYVDPLEGTLFALIGGANPPIFPIDRVLDSYATHEGFIYENKSGVFFAGLNSGNLNQVVSYQLLPAMESKQLVGKLERGTTEWIVTSAGVYEIKRLNGKVTLEIIIKSAPDSPFIYLVQLSQNLTLLATKKDLLAFRLGTTVVREPIEFKFSGKLRDSWEGRVGVVLSRSAIGAALSGFSTTDNFLVWEKEGELILEAAIGSSSSSQAAKRLPGLGFIDEYHLMVERPLSDANVHIMNFSGAGGGVVDATRELNVRFQVAHPCMKAWPSLTVEITDPDGNLVSSRPVHLEQTGDGIATTSEFIKANKAGVWHFKLSTEIGRTGRRKVLGQVQELRFDAEDDGWKKILIKGLSGTGSAMVMLSLGLFFMARRSDWAWRLATSDTLGTTPLRIGTAILAFVPVAQRWVLDRYFQRHKQTLSPLREVLPLPLSRGDARVSSLELVAPPWRDAMGPRRIWIEGPTGMGKTTLVRWVVAKHFHGSENTFAAHGRWRCVLVAFEARNFVVPGEDSLDAAWVLQAIEASLSSKGLTFENQHLLRQMLKSGTLGVVIDGLHEAGRFKSVKAFCDTYPAVPLLVTSQSSGLVDGFELYRLPGSMRDYTGELLALLMGDHAAAGVVFAKINASGLRDAIRSGYDVRLISELVRKDPEHVSLPANRAALYEKALDAGWPPAEHRDEEVGTLAAAAWRLVSERPAHADRRRLAAGLDAPAALLQALAAAPDSGVSVRLIRRVSAGAVPEYEFAHDQMHAYLAARYFSASGFTLEQLSEMLKKSTIWLRPPEEKKTLWEFVAPLLEDTQLARLFIRVSDVEEWDSLRRALENEGSRRGLVTLARVNG